MTEKQELTECVDFTTGAVAFIGYKLARIDLTPYGLGVPPGYIIMMLRYDRAKPVRFYGWDKLIPGYYATKSSRAGVSFYVALSHAKPKEQRVRSVIEALRGEGYLSRSQELAAYIGLGIPYSDSGEGR